MIIDPGPVKPQPGDKFWTVPIDEDRRIEIYLLSMTSGIYVKLFNGPTETRVAMSLEAAEALGRGLMAVDQELHPQAWEHWITSVDLVAKGEKA